MTVPRSRRCSSSLSSAPKPIWANRPGSPRAAGYRGGPWRSRAPACRTPAAPLLRRRRCRPGCTWSSGPRPARLQHPASMADRLTAIRSGVAQLSSAPSAVSPARRSIWGPSAARYTGAAGRLLQPGRGRLRPPGGARTHPPPDGAPARRDLPSAQQSANLGHVLAHHRDRAVRQAHRCPETGPVAPRAEAEYEPPPRTPGPAWPPGLPGSAVSTSAPRGRRKSRCAARCLATMPRRCETSPALLRPGSTGFRTRAAPPPGRQLAAGRTEGRAGRPAPRQSS